MEFHYSVSGFAGGFYRAGPLSLSQGRDFVSTDPTMRYDNAQPNDQLRVEVVGAESNCFATLTFPYCADLSLNPNGAITTDGTETLNVTTTASNGQAWPFDINYSSTGPNATFNGCVGLEPLATELLTTSLQH